MMLPLRERTVKITSTEFISIGSELDYSDGEENITFMVVSVIFDGDIWKYELKQSVPDIDK